MVLSPSLGQKIIDEVKTVLNEQLIVVDKNGCIIASTDESRIGTLHEGAQIVSKEGKHMIINKQDVERLRGVKTGINLPILFNDQVVGVIGITGQPEKVNPYGSIIKRMTELLIRENFYFQQLEWENRTLEAFVFDWIQGDNLTSTLYNKAELLGIDISKPRRCTLIHLTHNDDQLSRDIVDYVHNWLNSYIKGIIAIRGSDGFVILQEENQEQTQTKQHYHYLFSKLKKHTQNHFQANCTIGIGQLVSGNMVKQSYQQAEKSLKVAKKKQEIIFYEDLRLDMCLHDISQETKKDFTEKALKPLLADTELLQTLRVYLKNNLHLKNTATELGLHINTIHYRFIKIKKVTGYDFKEIKSIVTLYLALTFLDEYTINPLNS